MPASKEPKKRQLRHVIGWKWICKACGFRYNTEQRVRCRYCAKKKVGGEEEWYYGGSKKKAKK